MLDWNIAAAEQATVRPPRSIPHARSLRLHFPGGMFASRDASWRLTRRIERAGYCAKSAVGIASSATTVMIRSIEHPVGKNR